MAEKLRLIALHEIIRDGKDKKREVISPRTAFDAVDEENLQELLKSGAARQLTAEELKLPAGATAPDPAAAGNPNSNESTVKVLTEMNGNELKAEATKRKLTFAGNASKADLLKLLQDDDKKKSDALV
jgi:hypothetical protein